MRELKIDKELQELFPALSETEYGKLEQSILTKGFDTKFPIVIWHGYIADGHNRYSVCKKHNIDFVTEELDCETKDEVITWMMDIQMSRRNLSKVQKIIAVEKYRPVYERKAKENHSKAVTEANKNRNSPCLPKLVNMENGNCSDEVDKPLPKLVNPKEPIDTTKELAKMAGIGKETYRQAVFVLNSSDEELKNLMISGEKTISFCYKRLRQLQSRAEQKEKKVIEPVEVPAKKEDIKEAFPSDTPGAISSEPSSVRHKMKSVEELTDELLHNIKPKKGTELEWCKELSKRYISLMCDNLIATSSKTYAENVTKILNATVEKLHKIEKEYNPKPKSAGYVPRPRTGIDAIVGNVFEEEILPKKEEVDVSDKYPWLKDAPDNLHWDNDDSDYESEEDYEQSKYDWLNGMENVNPDH